MSQLSNSTNASNSHGESVPGQSTETTRNYSNVPDEQKNVTGEEEVDGQLTMRALVSTKEAGVIIGKGTHAHIYIYIYV